MRLVFTFFLLSLLSCTIRDKQPESQPVPPSPYTAFYNQIEEGEALLKEGDLIVRNGQELSSQLIRNFNRTDKSYSHSGLIFFKGGYPFVYHIVAGDENPNLKIRIDSLKSFCNPRKNFGFGIYRYNIDSDETYRLKQLVESWINQGVSFDSTFNLKTDDKMYCSEMIQKGLAKATNNRIIIATVKPTKAEAQFASTQLPLSVSYISQLNLVPIDNLYLNPACRLIRHFGFNNPQK
jgi:hypothetical protein